MSNAPADRETAAWTSESAPSAFAAGAMENLAVYLQSGCPRSAYRAQLLCQRLSRDSDADDRIRTGADHLAAAIADLGAKIATR